jgi:O-antigen ligase
MYLISFVGATIILVSSRCFTVAMLISIAAYSFFRSGLSGRLALIAGGVLLVASAGSIYLYALSDQDLNAGLRLYKGFNNRDDLWAIGLDLAAKSPFFGYGSVDSVQDAMKSAGASNSTAQNTALTMLLVFGIGGALIFLYLVLAAVYRFIRLRNRAPEHVAVAVLLLFALIDSLVRSYIVGGVGVVPLLMCASMAYLIRLRNQAQARYGS